MPSLYHGRATLFCKYESEYRAAARTCGLPFPRCLSPESIEWARREEGTTGQPQWQALRGMGHEQHVVVASALPTQREAAWARYEWLVAHGWLPPADTREGAAAGEAREARYARAEQEYKQRELAMARELRDSKWNQTAKRVRWAGKMLRLARKAAVDSVHG